MTTWTLAAVQADCRLGDTAGNLAAVRARLAEAAGRGADLVVLPTNWPTGAMTTVRHLVQCRALENRVYYLAANRVGSERGFEFIGRSRIVDCDGELLAASEDAEPATLYATIDPARAR